MSAKSFMDKLKKDQEDNTVSVSDFYWRWIYRDSEECITLEGFEEWLRERKPK